MQSRGMAFAYGIELVALPAIQIVSTLRRSISPQDSAMYRPAKETIMELVQAFRGDSMAWTGGPLDHSSEIKWEACNEPISRPGQCLSPARYSRGLLLWALFLYPTKQRS